MGDLDDAAGRAVLCPGAGCGGGEAEHAVGGRAGHAERGRHGEELAAVELAGAGLARQPRHRGMHRLAIDGRRASSLSLPAFAFLDPAALQGDFAQVNRAPGQTCRPHPQGRAGRPARQPVMRRMRIMKIMLMIRDDAEHAPGPDRRPDRQRQVGAGAGARRARRRLRHQRRRRCRSMPAGASSPRGPTTPISRARRIALYGHVACADALFRRRTGCAMSPPRSPTLGAPACGRSSSAAPASTSRALTEGLAAIPPIPPEIRARSEAHAGRRRVDAMLGTWHATIPRPWRGSTAPTRCGCSAPGRFSPPPAAAWRPGTARRDAPLLPADDGCAHGCRCRIRSYLT